MLGVRSDDRAWEVKSFISARYLTSEEKTEWPYCNYRKNDKANGIKAGECPERQRFGTFLFFLWFSGVFVYCP